MAATNKTPVTPKGKKRKDEEETMDVDGQGEEGDTAADVNMGTDTSGEPDGQENATPETNAAAAAKARKDALAKKTWNSIFSKVSGNTSNNNNKPPKNKSTTSNQTALNPEAATPNIQRDSHTRSFSTRQ